MITHAAKEAVAIGHGNAARLTLLGWEQAKKKFKATYNPTPADKDGFAKVMVPAYKKWYLEDFKGDPALFDSLQAEVAKFNMQEGY